MLIHAFRPNHGSSDTEHPSSTIYGRRPMHYRMCCFSSADKSQLSLAITQVEKSCVQQTSRAVDRVQVDSFIVLSMAFIILFGYNTLPSLSVSPFQTISVFKLSLNKDGTKCVVSVVSSVYLPSSVSQMCAWSFDTTNHTFLRLRSLFIRCIVVVLSLFTSSSHQKTGIPSRWCIERVARGVLALQFLAASGILLATQS